MANKKYISFNLDDDDDQRIVTALGRIQRFMDITPKAVVIEAVNKLSQSKEYKEALRKLIEEAENELGE